MPLITQDQMDLGLLSFLGVVILGLGFCLIEEIGRRAQRRSRRLKSAWLNQYKPGAFMARKEDTE